MSNEVFVTSTGQPIVLSDDYIVRLMFYLENVSALIYYDIPDRLKNFQNPNLTFQEKESLYNYAYNLSIEMFTQSQAMYYVNCLPDGFMNEFFELSDPRLGNYENRVVLIGGRQVQVLKVMFYTEAYYNKYYSSLQLLHMELQTQANINNVNVQSYAQDTNQSQDDQPKENETDDGKSKCCLLL